MGVSSEIGSLHDPDVIAVCEENGASEEALDILKHGLEIPFDDSIHGVKISRKNNKSAMENRSFVDSELEEMISKHFVEECEREDLRAVNPLTVAKRFSHTSREWKRRFCLDCSLVNRHIQKNSIKLPDIQGITSSFHRARS